MSTTQRLSFWCVVNNSFPLHPFYVLFVELSEVSLERQPDGVAATVGRLRLLLIATWGVYPISYLLPIIDSANASWATCVRKSSNWLHNC
jgi:hypothetical protein